MRSLARSPKVARSPSGMRRNAGPPGKLLECLLRVRRRESRRRNIPSADTPVVVELHRVSRPARDQLQLIMVRTGRFGVLVLIHEHVAKVGQVASSGAAPFDVLCSSLGSGQAAADRR